MRRLFGSRKSPPGVLEAVFRYGSLRWVAGWAVTVQPPAEMAQRLAAASPAKREAIAIVAEKERAEFWQHVNAGRLTTWEREFSATSAAAMTEQQYVDARWHLECVAVLRWALAACDSLPAYDVRADLRVLRKIDSTDSPLPALRAKSEIEHARSVAELWHWRCRTAVLANEDPMLPLDARKPGMDTFGDVVRATAARAAEAGDIAARDGDFEAFGKAFRDLAPLERATVTSIATQRHRALNWLAGYAPGNRWDETPTHT